MHPESLSLLVLSLESLDYAEQFYFQLLNQWSIKNGLVSD